MTVYGIDVSAWQGTIDWKKVSKAKGVEFVIMRAGYGTWKSGKDKKVSEYLAGCKKYNIPYGFYWYSTATTPELALQEGKSCVEVLKELGADPDYPIYIDIEQPEVLNLSQSTVSAIATAFCNVLEAAGYWAGIYMSAVPASKLLSDYVKRRYAFWVADYRGGTRAGYSAPYGIWQYGIGKKGCVSGISGEVDMDACSVAYPKLIKGSTESVVEDKSVRTYTVKKGDCLWNIAKRYYGDGSHYKTIMQANKLGSETIYENQVLIIP